MSQLQPMQSFDPAQPCKVHDRLKECLFDWKTEWAANYRVRAQVFESEIPGVIAWDGLMLDGWMETR
jgi:hypothetical protein